MGFGGGSDGSTGITDHVHSLEVGEGGALSSTETRLDNSLIYTRIFLGV